MLAMTKLPASCRLLGLIVIAQLLWGTAISYAVSNVIDDPEELYIIPEPHNPVLMTRITLKRTFHNVQELASKLDALNTVSATVVNQSSISPNPVSVFIADGTLEDLLDGTSHKLGYNWYIDKNNTIIFSALHPVINPYPQLYALKHDQHVAVTPIWLIDPADRTLRNALTHWCQRAGWQLIWNVNADYPITAKWGIAGTFEEAINKVLQASQHLELPLLATMHDSNKVIEIYSPRDNY